MPQSRSSLWTTSPSREPQHGIAHARNAAVGAALTLKADFIAITDDDCEPTKAWLVQMIEAQHRHDADVVRGRVVYRYPNPLPRWIVKPKAKAAREVYSDRKGPLRVGTNSVVFSARLVRDDGLALRFDPRFNFTGGEDTDFFVRAWEKGAFIFASDAPLVFEHVPPERCTYWRQVRRQYQFATGNTIIDLNRRRYAAVALGAIGRFLNGVFSLTAAIALGTFSLRRFRKHALGGGKKLMYAAGQISVLAGYRYEGYRIIDGV